MHNLSVIGKIAATPGTYNENGDLLTAGTYVAGIHANTTSEIPEWSDYMRDPQPAKPYRVYAGGVVPVCYVFPDEETFDDLRTAL